MNLSASLLGATKATTVPDVSVGHLLGHTVFALVVIVGSIWGVQKIWTRNRAKASAKPGRAASALTVISRQTLGKDHQLAVVRWGEREVLVGISGSNISFFEDSTGVPTPGEHDTPDHHDVLATASAVSPGTLSTNVSPGRSPFAAALSTVMSPRTKAKPSSTPSMALPMLERLRDLTERS